LKRLPEADQFPKDEKLMKKILSQSRWVFLFASGGQGGAFLPKVTGAGGIIENILSNKSISNRSPMPWGPLNPPQKLLIIFVIIFFTGLRIVLLACKRINFTFFAG
jgi:hypothetical protein